jgi:hypothetical protein
MRNQVVLVSARFRSNAQPQRSIGHCENHRCSHDWRLRSINVAFCVCAFSAWPLRLRDGEQFPRLHEKANLRGPQVFAGQLVQ